jgi:membrane associated rhomboid family serine protease
MPNAELPSSAVGWLVAIAAAIVGFLAGFLTIALLSRVM